MSVIEASSVGVKTMADGTLRITLDIEPRHAKDAFGLFGAPGTPCALAALKSQKADSLYTSPERVQKTPETAHVKGGELAKSAGIICGEPMFQRYVRDGGCTAESAAEYVREVCGVSSRRFIDHDPNAAIRYGQLMANYREWQAECTA
jgi:hypothetical protein